MRRMRLPCCARAASGHAAEPLRSVMNSRRRRQILICTSRGRVSCRGRIARPEPCGAAGNGRALAVRRGRTLPHRPPANGAPRAAPGALWPMPAPSKPALEVLL
jgi:hypothetical protein